MLVTILLSQALAENVVVKFVNGSTGLMDNNITDAWNYGFYDKIEEIYGDLKITIVEPATEDENYDTMFMNLKRVDSIQITGAISEPVELNNIFPNLKSITEHINGLAIENININKLTGLQQLRRVGLIKVSNVANLKQLPRFENLGYLQDLTISNNLDLETFPDMFWKSISLDTLTIFNNTKLESLGGLLKNVVMSPTSLENSLSGLTIYQNPALQNLGSGFQFTSFANWIDLKDNERAIETIIHFVNNPMLTNISAISDYDIIGPGFSLNSPQEYKDATNFIASSLVDYLVARDCPTDLQAYQAFQTSNLTGEGYLPCPTPKSLAKASSELSNWAVVGIMLGIFTLVLLVLGLTGLLSLKFGTNSILQQNFL